MRTIIDLPEDQVSALAAICEREGVSRAEAVRRAVALFTTTTREAAGRKDRKSAAFGLWKQRGVDGLAYERRLRREW